MITQETIDRDIELQHDVMSAYFTSGAKVVSDLYLYKQYRALLAENEELRHRVPMPSSEYQEAKCQQ